MQVVARTIGRVLAAALVTLTVAAAPSQASDAQKIPSSEVATGEVSPQGIVPAGNAYKTKATCEARGRYLMLNPPPGIYYSGFYCIKNSYNDRWSLLMDSPDVGCIVGLTVRDDSIATTVRPASAVPAGC